MGVLATIVEVVSSENSSKMQYYWGAYWSFVDWVPVSNCSCPQLYLYVVIELEFKTNK